MWRRRERQYIIYIGLNDMETKKQNFETDKYISILKKVCINYEVAFSFHVINGGYIHHDGSYTDENTLELTLLNVPEEKVMEIARVLCAFFRQERVMVVYNNIDKVVFVEEKLQDFQDLPEGGSEDGFCESGKTGIHGPYRKRH